MLNEQTFDSKETHAAYRVTYTHMSGEQVEATLCGYRMGKMGLDGYLETQSGIKAIDCEAVLHSHSDVCEDLGPSLGNPWISKTRQIKWERVAA